MDDEAEKLLDAYTDARFAYSHARSSENRIACGEARAAAIRATKVRP